MFGMDRQMLTAVGKEVFAQFGGMVAKAAQESGISAAQLADLKALALKAGKQKALDRSQTAQKYVSPQITAEERERLNQGLETLGMAVLPALADIAGQAVILGGQMAIGSALQKIAGSENTMTAIAAAGVFAATQPGVGAP